MDKKNWKQIDNFDDYDISYNGIVINKKSNRVLKGCIIKEKNTSYRGIGLSQNNKPYFLRLHRLLAIAFIANPDNLPCVDHIDGNGLNNDLSNLRWCNNSQNGQNREVSKRNKSTGIKNIYKNRKGYQFRKVVNGKEVTKYFKTLEEAVEFKKNWYKKNHNEFMVENNRT
tara:strand:+ start:964 stop:1473 length:510 start_codon:yes stop_codon:yes gene_type:complete